jgi:hypothetical protein
MSIVLLHFHTSDFSPLAEKTLKNKSQYAVKHGYLLLSKSDNWNDVPIMYEKALLALRAFELYPNSEWAFWSDCDSLITNMDIKLEDIVKNETKHFAITTDINGINAGVFFVRNTTEGRGFMQAMMDSIGKFEHEQAFIIDSYFGSQTHKDIISLYPQKTFNSYDYNIWGDAYPSGLDYFGNNGRWEYGDFIIHFPGTSLQHRLVLVDEYLPNKIVNTEH